MFLSFPIVVDSYKQDISFVFFQCSNIFFIFNLGNSTFSTLIPFQFYNQETKKKFIIIIDEWDCVFREDKENLALQSEYINFLRSLFKGGPADRFVKLAYITGILPIKKYGTQSALNNFRELTMTSPGGIAKYIGFTEAEVKVL